MSPCLKRNASFLFLLVSLVLLQSCSTRLVVTPPVSAVTSAPLSVDPNEITFTYDSDPPGATLFEIGNNDKVGKTPLGLLYRLSDEEVLRGVAHLMPTRVVWPSGANVSNYPGIYLELKKGRVQKFIFIRPDVPGRDTDYEAGLISLMQRIEKGDGR